MTLPYRRYCDHLATITAERDRWHGDCPRCDAVGIPPWGCHTCTWPYPDDNGPDWCGCTCAEDCDLNQVAREPFTTTTIGGTAGKQGDPVP